MVDTSRRGFLLGPLARARQQADALREPSVSAGLSDSAPEPLPPVIAWLSKYQDGARADDFLPAKTAGRAALHRPPGAVSEPEFLDLCQAKAGCVDCIEACPHGSLTPWTGRDQTLRGTPVIDVDRQPCWLCEEIACVSACESGALIPDAEVMGHAAINPVDCLNQTTPQCASCLERCPVPGALDDTGGVPTVNRSMCVGCGVCHYVCPAPSNAVLVLPNIRRSKATP